MVKTYPDYGIATNQFSAPDIDNAELAARLGYLSTLRRDGRLIFQDTFETTLAPYFAKTNCAVDNTRSYFGASCLKMAAVSAPAPQLEKYFPGIDFPTIGVEFTFQFETGIDLFSVTITRDRGSDRGLYRLNIDLTNNQIKSSSGAVLATIPTATRINAPRWNNFKYVMDTVNYKITRIYFNSDLFTVDYSIPPGAAVGDYLNLTIVGDTHATAALWLDNLVITGNEA